MKRTLIPALLCLPLILGAAGEPGQDLHLTYRSAIDDTDQPYRLYVPTAYDGKTPLPLVVTLHGTGGNQDTMFDVRYDNGRIKRVAEKHGVFVVSPFGRGVTEYRGIGENDILCVIAEVQAHYRIDAERIYCTGHSMGGTGSAYLALHHPELFAAVAPLAAAYSFPWLAENARHVPFWWMLGGKDYPPYLVGVHAGADLMMKQGFPTKMDILPGKGHGEWVADAFEPVFEWFLQHKRTAHPRDYTFVADTPLHGLAYSTAIDVIHEPGTAGSVTVHVGEDAVVTVQTQNVTGFSVLPDATLIDPMKPCTVQADGTKVFEGKTDPYQEVRCVLNDKGWTATVEKRRDRDLKHWHLHPVAEAATSVAIEGVESPLGNWTADAMREATGADIALFNRRYYRGLPLPQGKVDIIDVIQAVRPFDQYLVTAGLTGAQILKIIEDNIREPAPSIIDDRLVQVSGMHYTFDLRKPKDGRVISSDIDPAKTYKVVLEGQVPERETMYLAGMFGALKYQLTDKPFSTALYAYAAKHQQIVAAAEGRVKEVKE